MTRRVVRHIINAVALGLLGAGCGKNPLAPPGYFGFGVEAGAPKSSQAAGVHHSVSLPPWQAQTFTVTIVKVDVSETGDDWQTVVRDPVTVTVQGNNVAVAVKATAPQSQNQKDADFRPLKPGEYHGVRVWFGDRLAATANIYNAVPDALDNFGAYNPRTYTTRDGGLAFPFTVAPGQEQFVVFSFDFGASFTYTCTAWRDTTLGPFCASYASVLDKRPEFWPKVTVRVSKFKG